MRIVVVAGAPFIHYVSRRTERFAVGADNGQTFDNTKDTVCSA
jgi:hypothetical protein